MSDSEYPETIICKVCNEECSCTKDSMVYESGFCYNCIKTGNYKLYEKEPTLCKKCYCMTYTINGKCGKCKRDKDDN